MKKLILLAILTFGAMSFNTMAQDNKYVFNGNTMTVQKEKTTKTQPEKTQYKYKDKAGKEYPVYISQKGSCFIVKTSKEGKEYRQYLGIELSKQICYLLGREYKGKSNS